MKYLFVALGIFGGDLAVKDHIEKTKKMREPEKICGGHVVVQRYHNHGAFLNLGEKNPVLVRALSLGLTVCVFVLLLLTLGQKGNGLLKAGLGVLLGGAFSNTYDRLKRNYVVDYVSFHTGIKAIDRVVFNFADFAILIGAMLIALGA